MSNDEIMIALKNFVGEAARHRMKRSMERILIVEDELPMRTALADVLEGLVRDDEDAFVIGELAAAE